MKRLISFAVMVAGAAVANAAPAFVIDATPAYLDVAKEGHTWIRVVTPSFAPGNREETYKVFAHLFDPAGGAPITKGAGGKYTHHRGLFIGWKDTLVEGTDYDTWHMPDCHQQHVAWLDSSAQESESGPRAIVTQKILWKPDQGEPFIEEERRLIIHEGTGGLRVIDHESTLVSLKGTIELHGDLQHAGMQVRMADEVNGHQDSTQYILPEGAEEQEDDKVVGAWWVCCSPVVGNVRYWLMHMTPPNHPTGCPVYSIRRYARFGAFFEPDLEPGTPLKLRFRIVLSAKELDRERCAELYRAYAEETP